MVRATARTGLGVFTLVSIPRNGLALHVVGPVRVWQSESDADTYLYPNWIGLGRHRWIEPTGFARFLNHSCNPNVGFANERELVAMRDIAAGEELLLDYSTTEEDERWRMECACAAPACRRVIRAVQFLAPVDYARLRPHILPDLRDTHEAHQWTLRPVSER